MVKLKALAVRKQDDAFRSYLYCFSFGICTLGEKAASVGNVEQYSEYELKIKNFLVHGDSRHRNGNEKQKKYHKTLPCVAG